MDRLVGTGIAPASANAKGEPAVTNTSPGAFATTGATIVFATIVAFEGLFPRVMISSLDPAYHLTVYNASSSKQTLVVMLIVALVFLPLVLAYQGYSYWVFRKRVSRSDVGH